jgi:hypothetical protein
MQVTNRRTIPSLLLALLLGVTLAGCASTSINDLLAEPGRYANKEVTVGGRVVKSASVLGRGAYQIQDGGASMWVLTKTGAPRQGAKVKVKGHVRDVVNLGDLIKGLPAEIGSGLVMVETSHRAD